MRLHFELDMTGLEEKERSLLRKHHSMKKSISRDVLVPADITLHALHYAILRMYGWQNSHLHCFILPKKEFSQLSGGSFENWIKMAGVYFRFPSEDFEDIYWDDDYNGNGSIRAWFKRKYKGPYGYGGLSEHYLDCQWKARQLLSGMEEDAEEIMSCVELLERLPLASVLRSSGSESADFTKIREYVAEQTNALDIEGALKRYGKGGFHREYQLWEFLNRYNILVMPVTEQLLYRYDYGDDWEVAITCENSYQLGEYGDWSDKDGMIPDVSEKDLEEVLTKYQPICIAKDGNEMLDDVGGVHGFCQMLDMMYEHDCREMEEKAEREELVEWAEMQGYRRRRISPKQTL